MTILIRHNFIATLSGVIVPESAVCLPGPGMGVLVIQGDPKLPYAFEAYCKRTRAILESPLADSNATKAYAACFNLWAQFKREFRHGVFVSIASTGTITIVDVDNLYLKRQKTLGPELAWNYGVEQTNIDTLDYWQPDIPAHYQTYSWLDLLSPA